jgi:hypothetical protein
MRTEFAEQLARHLGFIRKSAEAFDAGERDEALRIAVSLRVLFHDTKNSVSLLTHLKLKNKVFVLSTLHPGCVYDPKTGHWTAVIAMWVSPTDGVVPPLNKTPRHEMIPAQAWWIEPVLHRGTTITRKDVILAAANQDGGAHVDAAPDLTTLELVKGVGSIRPAGSDHDIPLSNQHFPMLRQFAYEVLNSPSMIG